MISRNVWNFLSVIPQSRRDDEYTRGDHHRRHCTLVACAVVAVVVLAVCSGRSAYGQKKGESKLKLSLPEIFAWTKGDLPARSQITGARRFWIGENHLMKQKPKPGMETPGFLPDQRFPTYAQFAFTFACQPLQGWGSVHATALKLCRGVAAQEVVLLAGTSESIVCRFALVDVRTLKHADALMKSLLTLRSHAVSTRRNDGVDGEKKINAELDKIKKRGPRTLSTPKGDIDRPDQFWGNWNTSRVAAIRHGQGSFSYELGDNVVWCRGMSPNIVRQDCAIPYLRLVVVRNKTWFVFGLFQFGTAYRDITYVGKDAERNLVPPKKKLPQALLTAMVNAACRKMKAAMVEYDVPDNIRESLADLLGRKDVVLAKLNAANLNLKKMQKRVDATKPLMAVARKSLAKMQAKHDHILYKIATPGPRDIHDKKTGEWNVNLDPTGGYYSEGAGMKSGLLWASLKPEEQNIILGAGMGGADLMPLMDNKAALVYWSKRIKMMTNAIEGDEYRIKQMEQEMERFKRTDVRKWTEELKRIQAEIAKARTNQTSRAIPQGTGRTNT